ncbi:hypothetical protein IWW38_004354, partial [Coemansia aciculifera]
MSNDDATVPPLLQTPEQQQQQQQFLASPATAEAHINNDDDNASQAERTPLLPSAATPSIEPLEHRRQTGHGLGEYCRRIAPAVARCVTPILGACLAVSCLAIGAYVFYIACHIPSIILAVRGSEPELISASLIDMSDDSVVVAACLRFPRWSSRATTLTYANATVFHNGDAVGWLRINDLEVANSYANLSINEVFHISNQRALERLTSEVAVSRHLSVSIRAIVDLSGFGRYLPVVFVWHSLDIALPPPPAIQIVAVDELRGPASDTNQGGVTGRATIRAMLPAGFAANIDAIRFSVGYNGVSIARADIDPVSIAATGAASIPATVNIRQIAGQQHHDALADIARKIASSEDVELSITGAPSTDYNTAPAWLRRALSNVVVPVSFNLARLPPAQHLPSIGALVEDLVVDRLYAFWSAEDSFNPRASLAGHALVSLPNPLDANITLDVESLVARLDLLDDEQQVFAAIDTTTASIEARQSAPLAFNVSCAFESLGLDV